MKATKGQKEAKASTVRSSKGRRGRLIIAANRLPVTFARRRGELVEVASSGGLATGMASVHHQGDDSGQAAGQWVGWPGLPLEELSERDRKEIVRRLAERNCRPVMLKRTEFDGYYRGFSNRTLWPLFHYFVQYSSYTETSWRAYVRANEAFTRQIVQIARPGDTVWVHDYQLMLVPEMLRKQLPGLTIGFFLHIPFPSSEVMRLLPRRRELIEGMLGADLVGFHIYDYVRHFLSSVRLLTGYEHRMGQIQMANRQVRVEAFPMGIDYDKFADAAEQDEVKAELVRLSRRVGDQRLLLSVDRLDYTKGLPQRLESFELFLQRYPEYHNRVCLVMLVVPSRERVVQYQKLKQIIDELTGRINGRFGNVGWTPVHYLYRSVPFPELAALYGAAEVGLVTPVRDGMNLVAKEFVASCRSGKGVLVLSEMAGAACELNGALLVNPNDHEAVADSLARALAMPVNERCGRIEQMQGYLKEHDVRHWANSFTRRLTEAGQVHNRQARRINGNHCRELLTDWRDSNRRLLLLDYDGTLVDFAGRPEDASPDEELLALLKQLAHRPKTVVAIISGRTRATLENWFGSIGISLVAEHGGWVRMRGRRWQATTASSNDWKTDVRAVLEDYAERTPGTEVEEKELALVWHYRRADPELGAHRADELCQVLVELAAGQYCEVVEGKKVVEVRSQGVDKGVAVRWLLQRRQYDFLLVAGDDLTDEDSFAAVPEDAYTIKVGSGSSRARYRLESNRRLRALLETLNRR